MKKSFKLQVEGKNPERLLESIKNEIRKYIKREKRKPLPEGFHYWKFDCKFGQDDETPKEILFVDIMKHIDAAAIRKCESFYIELIASRANKESKIKKAARDQ